MRISTVCSCICCHISFRISTHCSSPKRRCIPKRRTDSPPKYASSHSSVWALRTPQRLPSSCTTASTQSTTTVHASKTVPSPAASNSSNTSKNSAKSNKEITFLKYNNSTRAGVKPALIIPLQIEVVAAVEVAVADGFHDVVLANGEA